MKTTISNFGLLFSLLNFAIGTIIGSFLNVVIYRLPRNESLIRPPSHCPNCGKELKWYDLVPILSFVILKGKCRYCGAKISPRYPLIEALTGLTFVLIGLHAGWSVDFVFYAVFTSVLIAVAFIDLFDGVVPDFLVIIGGIAGLLFNLIAGKIPFYHSLLGIGLALVFFGLIILLSKGGMGQG
ncbi:MAG: prepilin peptidase, partial [Caldisericaceae bacterium]